MEFEIGKRYKVVNKKSAIMSPKLQYLLGKTVEVIGEFDKENERIPIKILCEVPKGSLKANYILPELLDKEVKE